MFTCLWTMWDASPASLQILIGPHDVFLFLWSICVEKSLSNVLKLEQKGVPVQRGSGVIDYWLMEVQYHRISALIWFAEGVDDGAAASPHSSEMQTKAAGCVVSLLCRDWTCCRSSHTLYPHCLSGPTVMLHRSLSDYKFQSCPPVCKQILTFHEIMNLSSHIRPCCHLSLIGLIL